jgi:hypothetical protein
MSQGFDELSLALLTSLRIIANLQDSTNVTNLLLLSGIGNSYNYQTRETEFVFSLAFQNKTTLRRLVAALS